jgi:hypothetical protein
MRLGKGLHRVTALGADSQIVRLGALSLRIQRAHPVVILDDQQAHATPRAY